MGTRIETDMRRDAYGHLQQLSNTYFNNTKVGTIMGRITNDLFDVTEFAHHCPEEFFIAAIKLVVSFVILSGINLPLTIIVFLVVPFMVGVCMPQNLRLRQRFREQRVQIGELNARIEDSLLGQKVVKAFTNEAKELAKFEEDNLKFGDIKERSYHVMANFHSTIRAFDGVMYLVVLLAGGIFMVNGHINAGDLMAYVMYVSTLIATIRRIVEFAEQFQRGVTLMDGEGGYTGKPRKVLFTVLSKYEAGILGRMVHEVDPTAFIVFNEGCSVEGNFQRHIG